MALPRLLKRPTTKRKRQSRRQTGEPDKPTQPASAKQRILALATAEFASKGFDGARIDEIVRQAKISKNLLYYYFGSKERLFIEVLESAYTAIQLRQSAVSVDGLEAPEGMKKLITELFRHFTEVPEFIGLLNSENLSKAKHLKKSARIRTMYPPMVPKIGELLKQGWAEGVFRDDVDAIDLYIAISGMSYHALANQHTLSLLFARDFSSPNAIKQRVGHITDVVLGYLRHRAT